jgi:YVTN family beta-propeller protein
VDYDATLDLPDDFTALKDKHFDRALDPFVHYNVWGSQYDDGKGVTTSGGLANFVADGQDFVVTLGSFGDFGSEIEQAVAFMHELGHSIGLDHGGDVNVNCKPNYLSVMNYSFVYDGLTNADDGTNRIVDYSRERLDPLNEGELSEPAGIGAGSVETPEDGEVVFNTLWYDLTGAEHQDRSDGPLDWTGDGDETDSGPNVDVDLNEGADCDSAGPGQDLKGFDDWAKIELGQVPVDVAVNTRLNRVYVSNPFQNVIHVIDGATNAKLAPIPIEAGPQGMAVDEATGALYVALSVRPGQTHAPLAALGTVIDDGVAPPQVLPRVDLGDPLTQPSDVAIDRESGRIYVGGLGGGGVAPAVTVHDLATRQEITGISMPGPVRAIDLNADAGTVLAAGDRGVEMIDEARLRIVRHIDAKLPYSVATATGPGRQLFAGDFKSGEVHRLSYTSGEPR